MDARRETAAVQTRTATTVTLKDLRASERRIERARRVLAKKMTAAADAEATVVLERERHDALVESYRAATQ